jgi:hypothetical protein
LFCGQGSVALKDGALVTAAAVFEYH